MNLDPMVVAQRAAEIDAELWWFRWDSDMYGEICGGELTVDYEDGKLRLVVYVRDSDETDPEAHLQPLDVSTSITDEPARDQIRSMIHRFLCHEADEQMWFGEQATRPFYPEHPVQADQR